MKTSWQHRLSAGLTPRRTAALIFFGLALFAVVFSFSKLIDQKSTDAVPLEVAAPMDEAPLKPTNASTGAAKNTTELTEVVVHVTGAVQSPGVYTLKAGSRIHDAVEKAGPTAAADVNALNLAQKLSDGARIVVPEVGQATTPAPSASTGTAPPSSERGKVSINAAGEAELQTVSGIGPAKAQAIIAYRQEHGGFQTLDELKNVSGIGDKTFEKLKEDITL